jgi:hypothetical protein
MSCFTPNEAIRMLALERAHLLQLIKHAPEDQVEMLRAEEQRLLQDLVIVFKLAVRDSGLH